MSVYNTNEVIRLYKTKKKKYTRKVFDDWKIKFIVENFYTMSMKDIAETIGEEPNTITAFTDRYIPYFKNLELHHKAIGLR